MLASRREADARPSRLIHTREVHQVIENGWIIEDDPDDPRGGSCLFLALATTDALYTWCARPEKIIWRS
jgi:hypothetical protein